MAECFIMRKGESGGGDTDSYITEGLTFKTGTAGHAAATILVNNASMPCTNGVTLECCVRADAIPNDTGRAVTICSTSTGDTGSARLIIALCKSTSVASGSDFSCNYTANLTGSSEADKYISLSNAVYGDTHTYSLSVDNGTVRLYFDGVLINDEYSVTSAAPTMKTLGTMYGLNRTGRTLTGELFSVRVYSRPLSAAEVLENYNIDKRDFNSGL